MIGSILNEGTRGLQNSQREIARAANDISRLNVDSEASSSSSGDAQRSNENTPLAPLQQGTESERSGGIAEPLIELRRQELLFNASAEVVKTEDEVLGNLLDTQA